MKDLKRPPRDAILMENALSWARRSTCSRAQVGCVISRDGRSLSTGYNGSPSGMAHCDHSCKCAAVHINRSTGGEWIHSPSCPSQNPCENVVHAEANAIAFAARYGVGTHQAELHTTRVPCLGCAGLIINAGIIRVVWGEEHRDMRGFLRLAQAGVEMIRWAHE